MAKTPSVRINRDAGAEASAPTPSEQIVNAAKKVAVCTDALGRKISIRKLNALNKIDLARLLGPTDCANPVVFTSCFMAYSVTMIDGEEVMPPVSMLELRALLSRLDDEGLEAIGACNAANFGDVAVQDTRTGAVIDEAAAIKNS